MIYIIDPGFTMKVISLLNYYFTLNNKTDKIYRNRRRYQERKKNTQIDLETKTKFNQ